MNRALRWLLLGILLSLGTLAATCAASPVLWWLRDSPDLRVQVVDKTVPHDDYREHAALYWVLRHDKVRATDGGTDWALEDNYRGFHPDGDGEPPHGSGDELLEADLEDADLLYLADAYGVYEGDFVRDGVAALDTSRMIYGGLSAREVGRIERFVSDGGHLVAEFNTLASPTGGPARRRLERLLGVEWSGWSGRRFTDLGDFAEVPAWAPRLWRQQRETAWNFQGPGLLLVHEDTRLVILREPLDVSSPPVRVEPAGDHPLVSDVLAEVPFDYWFDIVSPRPGARVIARFRIDPTESGEAILREAGVPAGFPAVVVGAEDPLRLYFAGDFADSGSSLGPYRAAGVPDFNRLLLQLWFPSGQGQEFFYWGFYIPLMRSLIARF